MSLIRASKKSNWQEIIHHRVLLCAAIQRKAMVFQSNAYLNEAGKLLSVNAAFYAWFKHRLMVLFVLLTEYFTMFFSFFFLKRIRQ